MFRHLMGTTSKPLQIQERSDVPRSLRSSDGFSLIEMMIAILLLMVGVMAALSMVSTAIKQNSIANRLSVKTALGQQVMEELLSKNMDDPVVNTNSTKAVYDLNGTNTPGTSITIPGAGTFQATYDVSINTPTAGVTRIDVFSSFLSAQDTPLSITCFKRVQ